MPGALRNMLRLRKDALFVRHTVIGSHRRDEVEEFVRATFKSRFDAELAGWRCAADAPLFLESYLDAPVETAVAKLAGHPVERSRIVEVGNLAAARAGASVDVILALSRHLDRLGYEWVVFTATRELIGIFARIGLPLLALAPADPARLGDDAGAWGHYYETQPIVVTGPIRLAIERMRSGA